MNWSVVAFAWSLHDQSESHCETQGGCGAIGRCGLAEVLQQGTAVRIPEPLSARDVLADRSGSQVCNSPWAPPQLLLEDTYRAF